MGWRALPVRTRVVGDLDIAVACCAKPNRVGGVVDPLGPFAGQHHRVDVKSGHASPIADLGKEVELHHRSLWVASEPPSYGLEECSVRAVWYERQGPAAEVLQVGEMADPEPGPGEVRVRVRFSGVNPGDTKKRRGWLGSSMPFPRVIPHSDAAGVIDAVGSGVDPDRIGRRVWVYGAQSYRPFGTAAELTVIPAHLAVDLPDEVSDETGACLGIPGITAHRTVFADGPVAGLTVLVHGVLGGVGSMAAQLAHWGGATVIGTVRRSSDLNQVDNPAVAHTVALDQPDPAAAIRTHASRGRRPHHRSRLLRQHRPRRSGREEQHYHRRLRHPARPPRLSLLAHALRQHDDPTVRQRRLPGRCQAAGRHRSDHGRRQWRGVDPDQPAAATRTSSRSPRSG